MSVEKEGRWLEQFSPVQRAIDFANALKSLERLGSRSMGRRTFLTLLALGALGTACVPKPEENPQSSRPPLATEATGIPQTSPLEIKNPNPAEKPVSPERELSENFIIIIWDGVQRAHLLEMLARHELPNLQKLIDETHTLGLPVIDSETCEPGSGDGYRTQTGPANSAIVTGLDYSEMANQNNKEPNPIPDGLTLWEQRKTEGYVTGIVSSKNARFWPNIPLTNAKPEIDYYEVKRNEQQWVTNKALEFIQARADSSFLLFVHYREPDTMGHDYGENSPEYTEAIAIDDDNLGQLIQKLQELGIKEKTIIIVTTDHGFGEGGETHGMCTGDTKDLFLVVSGDGADLLGCVQTQTDIAPCLKNLSL